MSLETLCKNYLVAQRAANEAKRDILRQAIANGDDHLFSLNMRAVARIGEDQLKRDKRPR